MVNNITQFRTAEDWIRFLIDEESFIPLIPNTPTGHSFAAEIITGFAKISGRDVALWATRPDINQGYVTASGAIKIRRLMDRALELGIPIISLLASSGVSLEEGSRSGEEYSRVMMGTVELSGSIPQVACVMGVNIGAPAYSAALQDFVLFNKSRSYLLVSSPGVVKQVLGESTTFAELGGSLLHSTETGLAHFVDDNIEKQLRRCQWLMSFLPSNYREDAPRIEACLPTEELPEVPSEPNVAFDIKTFIAGLVDGSEFMEYSPVYGPNCVCAFARIGGIAVGLVANQSMIKSGALDVAASKKSARFIKLCDAYNIPLLTLIDAPGFMPGSEEEKNGILKAGAELIYAMKTRNPKLSVIIRKCYGASAIVLAQTRNWNGDLVLAFDNSRNAVMGFEAAKEVIYKNDTRPVEELKADYFKTHEEAYISLRMGLIDEVIAPAKLRARLIQHLELLSRKRPNPHSPVRGIGP